MEIKSIFTDEAASLLDRESKQLTEELREAAVNEALRSRGEPVEVTASDVRKARGFFQRRQAHLRPTTALLLRSYVVGGAVMFVIGMMYPYIREFMFERDIISKFSFLIAVSGLLISLASFFMMNYLSAILRAKSRRAMEEASKEESQP